MLLKDICQITMGQSPRSESYNDKNVGIPFYQGNADFGELYPTTRLWCSEPKKIANRGDLLISVRAPIGAINYAKETCCIGRGLATLKINPNIADNKFLYYFLLSQKSYFNSQGNGSTFKAISKNILEDTKIPSYNLAQQKYIGNILNKIYIIQSQYKQILSLCDIINKALFVEIFGDPIENQKKWDIELLSNLGTLNRGISKHRPRNDEVLLGGIYPLIQTGDIANADTYITEYKNTYSEEGLKQSKMWSAGTLCITIAANIAKTAILAFDACFPDSVVGFEPNNKVTNVYLHYWFTFIQKILEEQAPESAQKNINLKILSELQVIVPPMKLQNQFVDIVRIIDKHKLLIID